MSQEIPFRKVGISWLPCYLSILCISIKSNKNRKAYIGISLTNTDIISNKVITGGTPLSFNTYQVIIKEISTETILVNQQIQIT